MPGCACSHCSKLIDEVTRLRNTRTFYRWWLWQVGQALRSAPAPRMPGSTYGRWWYERRAAGLRGVVRPPVRRCTLCQEERHVLYLVPPSRRKDPSDDAGRLCVSCYVAFYGGDAHWPLPEDERPR